MTKPIYSLVIPIYNEEENITEMYRRLINVTAQLDGEVELILIDDGSRDRSLSMIRELHHCDRRVRYLSFARNFGHQIAVTAGLNFVQGKSIIVMDADLQDPPELILKIRLATYRGLLSAGVALFMILLVLYWRLFDPVSPLIGFTLITIAMLFLGSVQLLCIRILGEYIGHIYEEVKGRPIYTLKETGGFTKTSEPAK